MRKPITLFSVLVVSLFCLVGLCRTAAAQDAAAPQLKSVAIGKVKVAQTLEKAAMTSGKGVSLSRVAEMMDGQLIDRFHNTRKFRVLARSDLDRVIEEQGVHKAGEIVGAQYLVVLSVDDFQDHESSTDAAGLGGKRVTRTVRMVPVVKIYDSLTNEVLETANLPVDLRDVTARIAGVDEDGKLNDAMVGELARLAADRIVNRVIDVLYPAKVVTRMGQQITVNRGDGTFIAVGETWNVRGPDQLETDPDTGVQIRVPGPMLGKVRVAEVRPVVSIADVIEEVAVGQIAKGASLTLAQPAAEPNGGEQPVQQTARTQTPTLPDRATPAPTGPMVVGVWRVKVNDAVAQAVTKAGKRNSLDRVMQAIDTQLTNRLHELRKFQIVAMTDLADVVDVQKLEQSAIYDPAQVVQLFRMKGARYVVITTIDDFQDQFSKVDLQALNETINIRTLKMSAVANVYDVESGLLVESPDVQLKDTVRYASGAGGSPKGDEADDMLIGMARQLAEGAAFKVADVMFPISVLDRTGRQVTLNRGGSAMVAGQVWLVRSPGRIKRDPTTGKALSIPGVEVGRIQITEVQPEVSVGQVVEEAEPGSISEGCVVRPAPAPPQTAAPGAASQVR